MKAEAEQDVSADLGMPIPERGVLIMKLEMPGEEQEKCWNHQTDWLCTNNQELLKVTAVSDDGKAWFLRQLSFNKKSDQKEVVKEYDAMLQAAKAKSHDTYHYFLCELEDSPDFSKNEELVSQLPNGEWDDKNKFKDYDAPINLDSFTKALKQHYSIVKENPGSKDSEY